MDDLLLSEDSGGARVLTLNRPDALNAFNQVLWYSLAAALEDAAADDSVRCVVLTGTGRAFTAGQDLDEMSDPTVFEDSEPGYERLMPVVEEFPKPLIAAVNGLGVGIGLTLLLHCDIALISTEARLKAPFISLGVTTEASASLLLPAAMGRQRAAEVLYTEPWVSAEQAVADGLALRAVAPDRLMPETMEIAHHIGALPLGPLMATKTLLTRGRLDAVREARVAESAKFVELIGAMSGGSDG
ncbi:MAG: enoyl-CoA hydratase/isomerase family protein [Actinomycetia bacterium]|nr:enoyl-CoA hydratase/isomerase family protein [Actinomycetes bacterium]